MIFEDAHWSDPTSLDLLDLTVERVQRLPALLLVTFRPELQPPWTGQAHVTAMMLSRLNKREGANLVGRIIGSDAALSNDMVDQIVERADGVPLFIEELTKALLEVTGVGMAGDGGRRIVRVRYLRCQARCMLRLWHASTDSGPHPRKSRRLDL